MKASTRPYGRWQVLHDRKLPRSAANIGHLAVTSEAVWVLDAKRYKGKVETRGHGLFSRRAPDLYVGGRNQMKLVEGVNAKSKRWRESSLLSPPSTAFPRCRCAGAGLRQCRVRPVRIALRHRRCLGRPGQGHPDTPDGADSRANSGSRTSPSASPERATEATCCYGTGVASGAHCPHLVFGLCPIVEADLDGATLLEVVAQPTAEAYYSDHVDPPGERSEGTTQ